ncbi:methyltransferase domain-containing protein [Stygiolobus caldivivus]|uniref:Methyltransferase type 12 n=1 Tax=Stygiolobus caldivivus TaxID=2824673 RepID=A0A8D5U6D4_9CREN|nr:methyltransferase domain-containing protein [Stygiolobus caldivivus]BCU69669.1 methyltransferase type 12 [Stygiolobus caldivivus]
MASDTGKELSEILELIEWQEDMDSDIGKRRFEEAIKLFRRLDFPAKDYTVLEVAGGTGIGGIALAKSLMDNNFKVSRLVITDLREKALEKAKEFSRKELGLEAETRVLDAREVHKLGVKADVILMYGNSHPHFSTLDMVKFLSSASLSLKEDGVLLIQGVNTFLSVINRGYKQVLVEKVTDNKVVVSIHAGYDEIKGKVRRVYIDLVSGNRVVIDLKFWDFAEIIGLCKVFFKEASLEKTDPYRGIVICKYPRGSIIMSEVLSSVVDP